VAEAYTFSELAQILSLSRSTIQSLAKKGELPSERRGRHSYVTRSAVEAFLQRCMLSIRTTTEPKKVEVDVEEVDVDSELDARGRQRLTPKLPMSARIGGTAATVLDLSDTGLRIHHDRALRIGSEGRLSFEIAGIPRVWVVRVKVEWSRLSAGGYISGIFATEHHDLLTEAIACLRRLDAIEPDCTSLQRKREATLRKEAERMAMRNAPKADIDQAQEQAALIRATMERLRCDPLSAQRWYSRARYALASESVRKLLPARHRERDEALAIWEALGRRVDLRAVCRIVGE